MSSVMILTVREIASQTGPREIYAISRHAQPSIIPHTGFFLSLSPLPLRLWEK